METKAEERERPMGRRAKRRKTDGGIIRGEEK